MGMRSGKLPRGLAILVIGVLAALSWVVVVSVVKLLL